ncbi:hypothetical protein D8B29_24970 [Verminephrobacter eiseniae]|nr:hypothetical protein [Verminephrobacter eiseniae]
MASDATPRCASMASADRQMIGDATVQPGAAKAAAPHALGAGRRPLSVVRAGAGAPLGAGADAARARAKSPAVPRLPFRLARRRRVACVQAALASADRL